MLTPSAKVESNSQAASQTTSKSQTTLHVRPGRSGDRQGLFALVAAAGVFSPEEVTCAQELIDSALKPVAPGAEPDYRVLVAEQAEDGSLLGYVLFGRVPFTRSSFDLYWLATHPEKRRQGAARQLCAALEDAIRELGGTHIRVETSGTAGYTAARLFYERVGYQLMTRLPDFYKPGDDLFSFLKRV